MCVSFFVKYKTYHLVLFRGWWPACAGVVCEAHEGSGRTLQSSPERSEGFDVIIRPEPEGDSQTRPKQIGPDSHYNAKFANSRYFRRKLCRAGHAEPGVAATDLLDLISVLSIHECHAVCVWSQWVAVNDVWFGASTVLCTRSQRSYTSQWPKLRVPFSKNACANNFPLFRERRNNGHWKPGNTTHMCIDHNGNNVRR